MTTDESSDIPYRYGDTIGAGTIAPAYEGLGSGEGSGVIVSVAGRIMRHRKQGRLVFSELRDWSGSIQLFCQATTTKDFDRFVHLGLGDCIGVKGEVVRTKRGELSVAVDTWVLLAKARRGFGDKWKGVHNVEVRRRQREVDLWANEGVRERFLVRSAVIGGIRRRLEDRGFVEVETPVLQSVAGGANARPFVTYFHALDAEFYLRIATELYLKRLVVGGFERVYEIGKDFRNEGLSPKHNPEFTMLEAYQAYGDYNDMAELVESLVVGAALDLFGGTKLSRAGRPLDLKGPWRRATMVEVIAEVTGLECALEMGEQALRERAKRLGVLLEASFGPGRVLTEIYEKTTETKLWDPVHVMDYPQEVSPLVRGHRSKPGYVERLTPVIAGLEIAECYSELVDPDEQRERLLVQAAAHAAGDEEAMSVDEDFLRALEHGMPPTGGIGIGIDRLVMLLSDQANIRDVILFPALRTEGGELDSEA